MSTCTYPESGWFGTMPDAVGQRSSLITSSTREPTRIPNASTQALDEESSPCCRIPKCFGPRTGSFPRLSRTGMSVVASTQALGWEEIHGVITEGRLEDFFDYSAPFHIVAFNLKGAPTVEWKLGTRFSRFQAQPGELLITPTGEGHSIRQLRPNVAFSCCLSQDRLQSLAEQEWNAHRSPIEIVESFNRDVELWTLGQRLAARLRSPIPGSRLFAETLVTQIAIKLLWDYSSLPRPIPTAGGEADRSPSSPGDRLPPRLVRAGDLAGWTRRRWPV